MDASVQEKSVESLITAFDNHGLGLDMQAQKLMGQLLYTVDNLTRERDQLIERLNADG
tara:strand:+ start:351 stop:524 length:174 start_codon:yes stop_codon:yes gene_type:complete